LFEFEGRALIANSCRLTSDLNIYRAGTTNILVTDDVKIDPKIGAHSFIQSIVTQFQASGQGIIENLIEYPRFVKQEADTSKSLNDMLNSDMVCELRCPDDTISRKVILPRVPRNYGGEGLVDNNCPINNVIPESKTDVDFSIKPRISINKVVGSNLRISYQQSGAIKLTFLLERNQSALYGNSLVSPNTFSYALSNMKMTFMTIPDILQPQPVAMRTTLCMKNHMGSAVNNMSSKVPAVCDSMNISYMPRANENNGLQNNVQLYVPPGLSNIQYMFNDSFNKYVSYEIKDRVEMVYRGLDAMPNTDGNNDSTIEHMSSNKAFVTGLNWGSAIDLSSQKFNVNTKTNILNGAPYIQFMYFHSFVTI
jgi:hypothetical protein